MILSNKEGFPNLGVEKQYRKMQPLDLGEDG